jgi:hypothetical protein
MRDVEKYIEDRNLRVSDLGRHVLSLLMVAYKGRLPREVATTDFSEHKWVLVRLTLDHVMSTTRVLPRLLCLCVDTNTHVSVLPHSSRSIILRFSDSLPSDQEFWPDLDTVIQDARDDWAAK